MATFDVEKRTSESQIAAVKRYRAKTYDTIGFDVPKGKRDEYKQKAELLGMSLAKFLTNAAEEFIMRHAGEDWTANQLASAGVVMADGSSGQAGEVLSREEKRLLEEFRRMPADSQKHVRGLIRAIVGAQVESD